MATQSNNFTRSNVNAATLQITNPGRSSFNLSHRNQLSIPFGKIVPVSTKILLPTDTFSGSLKPNFHLEKIGTPSIGATRLDTHTFVVNFRRINKDLRSNLENGQNFFPSINIYNIVNRNLGFLLGYSTIDAFLKAKTASPGNPNFFRDISTLIFATSLQNLYQICNNYSSYGEYCYQLDKYLFLIDYYHDCDNKLKSLSYQNNDPRILFLHALPMFLKPFVGEGSLLDYLGYCSFTNYNLLTPILTDLTNTAYSTVQSEMKKYLDSDKSLIEPYMANTLKIATSGYSFSYLPYNSIFSELPIRAYYSVWYDYLRNWHIEERKNILDPDTFSNTPVVKPLKNTTLNSENVHLLSQFLSLCTLRSRDYGTDFLTSIQTDDAFRHVYSPVFGASDNAGTKYLASINKFDSSLPLTPENINGLYLPDSAGNLFTLPSDTSSTTHYPKEASFVQDFQTMRRCGMLEKWLARNYYYPDTYVGRLQARFGVRPSDYEVLVSQYIGGSESFITGQELVANMSTSESVVGSRNLKADVSTVDNFNGTVSDYSILISVVSTIPVVTYDAISTAAKTVDFIDFPQPEFATDTRVEARASDFLRGFSVQPVIGYVPRYYMFRVSPDESHGRYLTDYRNFNWLRDNYSMSQENFDFSLNPYSLRVNLPLNAFIGLKPWDDFAYGSCDVNLVVNRALPAAIEII